MRNGNQLKVHVFACSEDSSYPTYEEWKLCVCYTGFRKLEKRSYPTYEEWKPNNSV